MYVDESRIREAEKAWGVPAECRFEVETSDGELAFIRRTQKDGRSHDVTLLIRSPGEVGAAGPWAVIAKHDYPAGAFRPPSGGLAPGESIGDGARRECREETGLVIELERYLLRARVRFAAHPGGREPSIEWTSHVFVAAARGTELAPADHHEIREAAWRRRDELLGPVRELLLRKDAAGIRYRVALHDAMFAELDRRAEEGAEGGEVAT